jgi:putative endonuclease
MPRRKSGKTSSKASDKPPPAPERQVAFKLGLSAENRAAALLLAKGFRIAARRFRCPAGEIDIVARRGALLIFVEVKARALLDDAAWSVTERQRRRIASAASAWLAAHPEDSGCDMRFDAVLVAPRSLPQHLQGAFEAD